MKIVSWIRYSFGIKNLLVLLTVIFVIASFLIGPSIYKSIKLKQFEGATQAIITSMSEKKTTFQHLNGANTKTIGYSVTYLYSVDNKDYATTEFIKPNADVYQLFERYSLTKDCKIEVKYSVEDPSKSIITNYTAGK